LKRGKNQPKQGQIDQTRKLPSSSQKQRSKCNQIGRLRRQLRRN